MKKRFSLLLASLMVFATLTGCSPKTPETDATVTPDVTVEQGTDEQTKTEDTATSSRQLIRIGVLSGPTAIGAAALMNEVDNGQVFGNYEFQIYTSPDEVTTKIINGELDAAAVPVNLASVLYNKTEGQVQMAAINTLGTLYIVENSEEITSVADLSGKTIVMSGQGSVPEYVLQFILDKAGVTDCTIEYMQTHAEVATAIAGGEASIALLPEPFVSVAQAKNENVRVAIDVAKEWDAYSYEEEDVANTLTMGCLIVRKDFAETYQEDFNKFLDEYEYFLGVAVEDVDATAQYAVNYEIVNNKDIAAKAIPNCNIVYISDSKMLRLSENFLNIMFEANPKSIGGALPDENFYYVRQY